MLTLDVQDVFALRGGGGALFTAFIDSLIRATASRLPIRPVDIHTNMRVNIPDGGVDTQVDVNGNDPDGRLIPATLWQYKATEYRNISDADIQAEIADHQYAQRLIGDGYGYRLCICDEIPPETKIERLAALKEAVRGISDEAAEPIILTAGDLVAWANQYPAVVAKAKRLSTDKFRFFDSWKKSAAFVTPTFVPTPRFEPLQRQVDQHLDWSQHPASVALTVYGEAGVGKTRSVLEVLQGLENRRELVIYTADESEARALATYLANAHSLKAILVADECLTSTLLRLEEILRGFVDRVRVLTIDNNKERHGSLAPQLEVTHLSDHEVEEVLAANFPRVSPERRRRYAFLSSGFLRLAADMCHRDASIAERGDVSPALESIHNYYADRMERMGLGAREALELLSLVDRIGYREEVANELDLLCGSIGANRADVQGKLERLREAPGFVVTAGRYYYVTPALIAMIAFESAWIHWIRRDPDGFLRNFPAELTLGFQRRVSTSASQEVARVVTQFFREWTTSVRPDIFGSQSEIRRFLALLEADPEAHVPVLRRLVDSASLTQLEQRPSGGGATPRRQIIWMAERLAAFPEFFRDSEAILFRLASDETEPSLGNNATRIWESLFRVFLSGSPVPLVPDRLQILRQRYEGGGTEAKLLVLGALEESLTGQPSRMLGPPLFGTRLPPEEWRPRTREEYRTCIASLIEMLSSATKNGDRNVRERAESIAVKGIYRLLMNGIADLMADRFPADAVSTELKARLAASIQNALRLANGTERNTFAPSQMSRLEEWGTSLKPSSLHGRVVEEVALRPWSHHGAEEAWRLRLRALADELLADKIAFREELNWLTSPEAQAAAELGQMVGEADAHGLAVLDDVMYSAARHKSDAFARGYVFGITRKTGVDVGRLNLALDRVESTDPGLSFYIALPGGDQVGSFDRGIRLVREGKVSPAVLGSFTVWVGSRRVAGDEVRIAVETLMPLVESGNTAAGDTAIEFLAYQTTDCETKEAAVSRLAEIFHDSSLSLVWAMVKAVLRHPGQEAFWFMRVLEIILSTDPNAACEACAQMMLSDNFQFSEEASKIFSRLNSACPELLMETIGRYMLDPNEFRFYASKFPYLVTLPFSVVTAWLKQHGVAGARPLARHLAPPFLGPGGTPQLHPLTEFVLREFEGDDRTFSEFFAGVHSFQLYTGSLAAARTGEAQLARAFLPHPLRRARQWAEIEVREAESQAKRLQIIEEEERF